MLRITGVNLTTTNPVVVGKDSSINGFDNSEVNGTKVGIKMAKMKS